jgi:excisionase family DNA binding protein
MKTLLTVTEAAKRLKISPQRVRQLREAGRLDAVKVGPLWCFDPAVVDKFAKLVRPHHRPKSNGDKG